MLDVHAVFSEPSILRRVDPELPWWCRADAPLAPLEFLRACPIYRPTPLVALSSLAHAFGLGAVYVKDESQRLRLGSFKALGGAYAVFRIAQRMAEVMLGRRVPPAALLTPELRDHFRPLTICCASDGNHGRSVAAGARLVGAKCVVFLHAGVSAERAAHIERLGAEIIRIDGSYDKSVAAACQFARERHWVLVADTAIPEDRESAELCGFVMQGYTVLVDELLEELAAKSESITHVFVQAGVGGLAASVFGHWTARVTGGTAPRFVVVEPGRAACLLASARAGTLTRIPEGAPTIMAMLECQSPSPLAWPVVGKLASAFVAVSEEDARSAVRRLAAPQDGDPALEVGESGAAGLAGLARCLAEPAWRKDLGLDRHARALVIATEGPTDRSIWSGAR
jgi:diaminopropionate ammonia-lyase